MASNRQLALRVDDASQVASVRRAVSDLAYRLDFDDTYIGKAALLATEASTNVLKHADGGEILLRELSAADAAGNPLRGIEILAIDAGPGIDCLNQSMTDGVSTTGTAGTGLGAMRRIASSFEVYTLRDKGTVVCLRLWNADGVPAEVATQIGGVCLPMPGETSCGDAWTSHSDGRICNVLVADGLGHGPDAAAAADAAVEAHTKHSAYAPGQMIDCAHGALRSTRGAAVAAARLDCAAGTLTYAGVGNIAAILIQAQGRRQLVSHMGIVGSNVRKIQEFNVEWQRGDVLILHSDGLSTQCSTDDYPGLLSSDPAIIAAVLYRDYWRRRDDVTVVVVRF